MKNYSIGGGIAKTIPYLTRFAQYLKTTKITPPKNLKGEDAIWWMRKVRNHDDRFLAGKFFQDKIHKPNIQAHGLAKGQTLNEEVAQLRYLLDNGPHPDKNFFTGPLAFKGNLGSAVGTASGGPYTDGLFIVAGKPNKFIQHKGDIKTVYINDGIENMAQAQFADTLKTQLSKLYPDIDFIKYSEAFKQGGTINYLNLFK